MNFYDFWSPLARNKYLYTASVIFITLLAYAAVEVVVPDTQKTTLYFSVKPASSVSQKDSFTLDPLESSMKVAEMISGWAKDPSFRKMVLIKSKANVTNLKKKITAKKQNRANVFWTIKLAKKEQIEQSKLVKGVKEGIETRLATFNQDNQYPFAITPIEESIDYRVIPVAWRFTACVILALILSHLLLFIKEMMEGQLSFTHQVRQIFPGSPLLFFAGNKREMETWKHFTGKIKVKDVVMTFDKSEQNKSLFLADVKTSTDGDTTLIYTKLGETTTRHLENLAAAYAQEKVAIVVLG